VAVEYEEGVAVRGCLAQTGTPIAVCADGNIVVKLHLPQSERDAVAKLMMLTEVPLFISFAVDGTEEGQLVKRHGGARIGAGRKPNDAE
jgi:hypothetical protein